MSEAHPAGARTDRASGAGGDVEASVLADGAASVQRRPARRPRRLDDYLRAIGAVLVAGLAAALAQALWGVPDVEMLFLLGILAAALVGDRRAALLAAALAVLIYDFFFVPPRYTLDVLDPRYFLTFAMMFGVSVVIGTLALRLREAREAAERRERHTAALYALSRELASALDVPGVAAACVKAAADAFGGTACLLRSTGEGPITPLAAAPPGGALTDAERGVAGWAAAHGTLAGQGTETFTAEAVICAPVRAWGDVAAVLAIRPRDDAHLTSDQRTLLEALGRHTALALDRVRLAEEARAAALRARTEELRSGLLSTVSHDLRTPLATITGAATLLRSEPEPGPETRRDLSEAICEEAERLERLVSNLLDMTRLDSGAVQPRREWVPLVEVVGGALTRAEPRLVGRQVSTHLPEDLGLVLLDPVLVEQALINLLENAAKYTPPGTEIELRAWRQDRTLHVDVGDRGPGIPPGDEERVFERFQRGAHAGARGTGLGLPIARAIAQVHGGRLVAESRPGGGALFRLALPIVGQAPAQTSEGPGGDPR